MGSKPFHLDGDELYICCHRPFKLPNGKYSDMIRVYELQSPEKKPNMLTNMDWCFTPEIIDPNSTTGYNSLMINAQPVDYNKLVQDLCISRLRVNRRGNCYFQLNEGIAETTDTYGITFYRMNDLWKWSDYGVEVGVLTNKPQMNWDRLYILDGSKAAEVSDNQDIQRQLEEAKIQLKEKENEVITLNSQVHQKDGEVKKLQSELEDAKGSRPLSSLSSTKVAVPSTVFLRNSNDLNRCCDMYGSWSAQKRMLTLTPSHEVTNTTFPIPVTFNLDYRNPFDVNNWFYMRVKERAAPILIYEGNLCSLTVGALVMSCPFKEATGITWGINVGQEHFDFGPVMLVGYGARIVIQQSQVFVSV